MWQAAWRLVRRPALRDRGRHGQVLGRRSGSPGRAHRRARHTAGVGIDTDHPLTPLFRRPPSGSSSRSAARTTQLRRIGAALARAAEPVSDDDLHRVSRLAGDLADPGVIRKRGPWTRRRSVTAYTQ